MFCNASLLATVVSNNVPSCYGSLKGGIFSYTLKRIGVSCSFGIPTKNIAAGRCLVGGGGGGRYG